MRIAIFTLLVFLASRPVECRSIKLSFGPIHDGTANQINGTYAVCQELKTTTVTCDLTYSFLPCTTELWGEVFLIVVYELLLGVAANFVSSGSELFFRMFGTGIFSTSLFQVLGSLPSVIIMLVSSASSSVDSIETSARMCMAMLAGSAVYSLTILWGSIVVFGRHSLPETSPSSITWSKQPIRKLVTLLTGSGVETDTETKKIAIIMFVSMIAFLILQLEKIINSTTGTKIVVWITLVVTLILLIAHLTAMVFKPWIQEKSFEFITSKYAAKSKLLSLCMVDGMLSESLITELFRKIDLNNDSKLSKDELHAFLQGLFVETEDATINDLTVAMMKQYDDSHDSFLSFSELVDGITGWLNPGTLPPESPARGRSSNNTEVTTEEQESFLRQPVTRSTPSSALAISWNYAKAGFLIVLGTTMMIILGSPLMQSFQDVANDLNMPSFLASYVLLPLAMSYKQVLGAITSARKKTMKDISGPMSEAYRGVFMNNIMGLVTFLSLVLIKDITWNVSAEVLVVLWICSFMGILTSFRTKFPLWTAVLAYSLYPLSILVLYVLANVQGWS